MKERYEDMFIIPLEELEFINQGDMHSCSNSTLRNSVEVESVHFTQFYT